MKALRNIIAKNTHVLLINDILLDELKKIDNTMSMEDLTIIKDYFKDFDNIDAVKKGLKENYLKQVCNKQIITNILENTTSSGDLKLNTVKELNTKLNNYVTQNTKVEIPNYSFTQPIEYSSKYNNSEINPWSSFFNTNSNQEQENKNKSKKNKHNFW